ncbi:MAG TPA: 3-deoxy-manno-octulosonate cytidylyltransferase [Candidatus Binatia bacterium]|jgi:3-deoxy-manno-octulosonate cytidylyltransferase (CMP-KDO synthetase)
MAVVAIIPARYGSTRLPGKPLARIGGKPMIQRVYESASKAQSLDRVLVATDDRRIEAVVRGFGGEVLMTSKHHASGTDRLAEVARKIKAHWFVNVQGDLPFIHPDTITRVVRPMRRDRSIPMATVRTPIFDEAQWRDPNIVKVLTDREGFALYFSRSPIPYVRNGAVDLNGNKVARGSKGRLWGYRHVGLYVYRRDFLLKFARLRPTPLEQIESLEQLRALAHGYRIYVAAAEEWSVEVDTPEDLVRAENYLKRRGAKGEPWLESKRNLSS